MTLGILTGLKFEADIARKSGALMACSAADPQRARIMARDMVRRGAKRLISFGCAGGLEPGLPVGAVVLASQVLTADNDAWPADGEWLADLMHMLPAAHVGPVWGSEIIIAGVDHKRALYTRSHCLAVDMESQCVAQIAAESDIPFAVVRVVADTSETALPSSVMVPFKPDGDFDLPRILWNLLRSPTQIPAVLALGSHARASAKALAAASHILR